MSLFFIMFLENVRDSNASQKYLLTVDNHLNTTVRKFNTHFPVLGFSILQREKRDPAIE